MCVRAAEGTNVSPSAGRQFGEHRDEPFPDDASLSATECSEDFQGRRGACSPRWAFVYGEVAYGAERVVDTSRVFWATCAKNAVEPGLLATSVSLGKRACSTVRTVFSQDPR